MIFKRQNYYICSQQKWKHEPHFYLILYPTRCLFWHFNEGIFPTFSGKVPYSEKYEGNYRANWSFLRQRDKIVWSIVVNLKPTQTLLVENFSTQPSPLRNPKMPELDWFLLTFYAEIRLGRNLNLLYFWREYCESQLLIFLLWIFSTLFTVNVMKFLA